MIPILRKRLHHRVCQHIRQRGTNITRCRSLNVQRNQDTLPAPPARYLRVTALGQEVTHPRVNLHVTAAAPLLRSSFVRTIHGTSIRPIAYQVKHPKELCNCGDAGYDELAAKSQDDVSNSDLTILMSVTHT